MSEERRSARVQRISIGIAAASLGLSIWGLAEAASHLPQRHPGWGDVLHEFMQDFEWLPLMAAAWWIKTRVQDWLNGG